MSVITIYHRKFPVAGAPLGASLVPYPAHQKHTFVSENVVYEASFHETMIEVPDNAQIDTLQNLLCWSDSKGKLKSTATEVLGFAEAKASGFRICSKK